MNLLAAANDASVRLVSHVQASLVTEDPPDTGFGDLSYTYEMKELGGDPVEISVGSIQLSLKGISLDNLDAVFFYPVMHILWAIYSWGIRIIAWFADYALGLKWMEWIREPFEAINNVIRDMAKETNLYAVLLIVTAFVCAIWIARGKWAKGLMELIVAVLIANFAVASLVGGATSDGELNSQLSTFNPLTLMLGTEDGENGWVHKARDFGTQIVGQIHDSVDEERDADTSDFEPISPGESIIETFLWKPVQLVNFDPPLGKACEDVYALIIVAGQKEDSGDLGDHDNAEGWFIAQLEARNAEEVLDHDEGRGGFGNVTGEGLNTNFEYDDEGWKVPGECVEGHQDYYEDAASFGGLVTQFFLGPSVFFLAIAIVIMAFAVLLAGVKALIQCVKFFFTILAAILPGGAKRSLWMTLGEAAAALLMLTFTVVFLGTFLVVINGLFDNSGSSWEDRIGTIMLIDVMLIVGIFIFWKGRKTVEQTKDKMAEALGKLTPGSGGGGGGGSAFGGGALGGAAGSMAMGALANKAFGGGNMMAGIRARELDHKEHLGRLAGLGGKDQPANDYPQVMGGGNKGARLRAKYDRRKAHPGRARAMRIGKGLLGKGALALATGGSSLLVQGGAAAIKSKALKTITSRTIGRKSKLGNLARRKVVQARNSVKQGVRGKFEQRRQGVVQARINRQHLKHNRKWQKDPTGKSTAKAQQKLNKMRTAEPERQDRQRGQDQTARFHDLRADAKLRHERRQEEREIAKRQHNREKWTKLVR